MLAQEITPTEIGKHANIIKAAQEELANMDVLVCGRCLRAFHFVEEFQTHKEDGCEKENANLKESLDTKPKIWAFTLWKATQLQTRKETNASSSWALYQHWVKLEEGVREPWIVAGKTIQSFGKIGHGELQDMPVRITKTVVNPNNNNNSANTNNANTMSSGSPTRKSPSSAKLPTVAHLKDTENERPRSKSGTPTPSATSGVVKPGNRMAQRTDPQTNKCTEEAVEKIVAKRFNPRRKTHEYLVKWVDRGHMDNTWESTANLERVPTFLQVFEKQLARQKLSREKNMDAIKRMQASSKTEAPLSPAPISPSGGVGSTASSNTRPSRTSKTKAMDQVKQWVSESGTGAGSTSPSSANDDESPTEQEWSSTAALKRKLNNTDSSQDGGFNASNDSTGLEDLEEDLIPSHTVKRLKNGGSISVEINKPKVGGTDKSIKVNGNAALTVANSKMAELIYTQDATATGMMRKADVPNSLHLKREKQEGLVRHLSKAEMLVSNTGIVRLDQAQSAGVPNLSSSPIPKHSPTALVASKRLTTAAGTRTASPVTVAQRTQLLRTPGAQYATAQRRIQGTPQTRATPAARGAVAGGRTLITRSGATPQQRQLNSPAGNKAVTPEQKILQLSKSGDLKVTRKVMTRDELLAQRAAQQQQQRQQLQRQQQQQSQVQIQKVQQLTPPRLRSTAMKSGTPAIANETHVAMEVEEDVHQARLCPITGKLIGQEETQLQMEQEQQQEQQREQLEAAAHALLGGDQQVLTNEDGTALLVRGEDGTVYQVAGKNAEGQTILVTQGPDGEQQFAYVAAAEGEDQDVLTLDNAVAEAVAQLPADHQAEATTADGEQILVSMTEEELAQHQAAALQQAAAAGEDGTSVAPTAQIHITTSDSDGTEANIPAEVVQADLPSPGGTRRVVLLLQDGTFMMTEMHDEQFKTLNIPT
ncbi:AF4/FMR2 family member 4 isoform X2 [Scaptodrosophila lebanonensis]|nr:AF4/FMR2 family member 4 isoform X2 [Scaptodrosophila lebanonensis]